MPATNIDNYQEFMLLHQKIRLIFFCHPIPDNSLDIPENSILHVNQFKPL